MNKKKSHEIIRILKFLYKMSPVYVPLQILNSLIGAILPFVTIIYSSRILDGIVSKQEISVVMQSVYPMIIWNVVLGMTYAVIRRILYVLIDKIEREVKANIGNKALHLDYELLEKQENMNLLYKAKEGTNTNGGIQYFCVLLGNIVKDIAMLGYAIILMAGLFRSNPGHINGKLETFIASNWGVLALFIVIVLSVLINLALLKRFYAIAVRFFNDNIVINRVYDYFTGMCKNYHIGKDIRLFHMQDMIMQEIHKGAKKAGEVIRISKIEGRNNAFIEMAGHVVIYCAYAFVGVKAILGFITVGSILKYISALQQFFTAFSDIVRVNSQITYMSQYMSFYCDFMEIKSEKYQGTLPIEKRNDNEYELEFRDVSFHYPNSDDMILNHVSLKLKVGRKMAIVGKNGAGKTTFIKLLCRLYDPTEGEILLNGINIKKYDYAEYLDVFGVVFQDFQLFAFSVGQNVGTSLWYERQKVWNCLEQAGVKERIKRMRDGLDTELYQDQENGVEISGGEAQKLAIARALYKDAPLVILDEPTSALDPVSEYEIYKKFDELVSAKTSIYISHRMSSCRFCDNIVVFNKGEIVENGSHEKLMEQNGLYRKMWDSQAKYYTA